MRSTILSLLLCYTLILVSATDITLSGVVLDELEQPVYDCKVSGWSPTAYAETYTDANGQFELHLTNAMEYAITFIPKFDTGLTYHSIPKITQDALGMEIILKEGVRMYSQVYSNLDHTILMDQVVYFYVRNEETDAAISLHSNATGFFEYNFVPGYYLVQVTGGTGSLYGRNITYVNVTGETGVYLSMSKGLNSVFEGYVTNEDSSPETEAYLSLRNGTYGVGVSHTQGDGYFSGTVPKGHYTLQITSFVKGASYAVADVSLQGDSKFMNVTIPPGHIFQGNLECALPNTYVVFIPISPDIVSNGFSWGRGIAYHKDYRIILQPGLYHFRAYSPDTSVQEHVLSDNIMVNSTTVLNYNFSCDSNFFRTDCQLSSNEYYCSDDLDVFEPSILYEPAQLDRNLLVTSQLDIYSPSFTVGGDIQIQSNGVIKGNNCSFEAQEIQIKQGQMQLTNSQIQSTKLVLEGSEMQLWDSQLQTQDLYLSNSLVYMKGSNIICSGTMYIRNESVLVINGEFESIQIQYNQHEGEFFSVNTPDMQSRVAVEYKSNILEIYVLPFVSSEVIQTSEEESSLEESAVSSEEISSSDEESAVSSEEISSSDEELVTTESEKTSINEESVSSDEHSSTDNTNDSTGESDSVGVFTEDNEIQVTQTKPIGIGLIILMVILAAFLLGIIIYLIFFAASRRRKGKKDNRYPKWSTPKATE